MKPDNREQQNAADFIITSLKPMADTSEDYFN